MNSATQSEANMTSEDAFQAFADAAMRGDLQARAVMRTITNARIQELKAVGTEEARNRIAELEIAREFYTNDAFREMVSDRTFKTLNP